MIAGSIAGALFGYGLSRVRYHTHKRGSEIERTVIQASQRSLIMARFDLSDFEWSVIEPLLPDKPRGVPRVDDRRVLDGMFWVLASGAPWADLLARFVPRH